MKIRIAIAVLLLMLLVMTQLVNSAEECAEEWFFEAPLPDGCPLEAAVSSNGSFMQFENGFMMWSAARDAIFVLYISEGDVRWQEIADRFQEGMLEVDSDLNALKPPYTFQPRRGMGLIWRENDEMRERLGWAVAEYEFPYEIEIQMGQDGTTYVRDWRGGVFVLLEEGADWMRYEP
jgi:hypothetical protein